MAKKTDQDKQPIMGCLDRPYQETGMSGRNPATCGGLFV